MATLLDEEVSAEQLRGMLRLREVELRAAVEADTARLAGVAARLRVIEQEGAMPDPDIVTKPVAAVRVVELTAQAASYAHEDIGSVVGGLFADLTAWMAAAGVPFTGPAVAGYATEGDGVLVRAGMPCTGDGGGLTVAEWPGHDAAATLVHHGGMDAIDGAYLALSRWAEDGGLRPTGIGRETYLHMPED